MSNVAENIISTDRSAGGINKYCHYCDVNCKQTLYAICLHTIDYIERGNSTDWDRCEDAIRTNNCPAQAMRKEELDAGQALYFSEWILKQPEPENPQPKVLPKIDKSSLSYKRGWNAVGTGNSKIVGIEVREIPAQRRKSSVPLTKSTGTVSRIQDRVQPAKQAGDEMMTMDMSKMVDDSIKEQPKKKIDTARLPGETTIAYINRIKRLKDEVTA